MNYDHELGKAIQDMKEAEDALVEQGFSEEHWMLIKGYIHAAIVSNQIGALKTLSELQSPSTD